MNENSGTNQGQEVSVEDIALSNMMEIVTICQLLVEKGIITNEEYLNKLEQVKKEYIDKYGDQ